MAIKTYKKGVQTKLSENFSVSEFACHGSGCCYTVKIDEKLVIYLQKIREHFGKAVTITSGYRCEKHNKSVGGATASRHAKGQAADIVVDGVAPAEVAKYAESIGILGIGLYETAKDGYFVHVDTRTGKSFWYGQAQAYRSTFGGATEKAELPEDGKWGVTTTKASQKVLGTTVDGIVSNQPESCKQYLPAALETSWEFKEACCASGSGLIRAIQKLVGAEKDGHCGKETVKAVQRFLKAGKFYTGSIDGIMGKNTVIGWQKYLNSRM